MPSSFTSSARYTLQATGENNNTWGVILNSGVFQLVDDNVNGRLAFALSGAKVLTTALGATDEARLNFLDVTGGTGGSVTVPSVSQGHFVRNAAAGDVVVTAGGLVTATFQTGDAGPIFSDGANVYPIMLSGKPFKQFITDADAAIIAYVNLAISSASTSLPPAIAADVNKSLMNRQVLPGQYGWVPSQILTSDVLNLDPTLAALTAQQDELLGMIFLF